MKQWFFIFLFFAYVQSVPQSSDLGYYFTEYHLIDISREELYPHDAAHYNRELMLHIWMPITAKQCPLILFSHGLGDNFNGMTYTQLCQFCASQGYIIVSVSHTYACKPLQLSDGHKVEYLFPSQLHCQSGKHMFDKEAEIWVDDMIFALNECMHYHIDEQSLLYNKIDIDRIGIMGHSLGGAVAIQVGQKDKRIAAIINLDGPLYGIDIKQALHKPCMTVIGPSQLQSTDFYTGKIPFHKAFVWRWYFNQRWLSQINTFVAAQYKDIYKVTIDRIVHETFSDAALYPDDILKSCLIDSAKAHEIIHAYIGAFFDYYLKGSDNTLLQVSISPWSNVTVEEK